MAATQPDWADSLSFAFVQIDHLKRCALVSIYHSIARNTDQHINWRPNVHGKTASTCKHLNRIACGNAAPSSTEIAPLCLFFVIIYFVLVCCRSDYAINSHNFTKVTYCSSSCGSQPYVNRFYSETALAAMELTEECLHPTKWNAKTYFENK